MKGVVETDNITVVHDVGGGSPILCLFTFLVVR